MSLRVKLVLLIGILAFPLSFGLRGLFSGPDTPNWLVGAIGAALGGAVILLSMFEASGKPALRLTASVGIAMMLWVIYGMVAFAICGKRGVFILWLAGGLAPVILFARWLFRAMIATGRLESAGQSKGEGQR